jgi:hypothetical protein
VGAHVVATSGGRVEALYWPGVIDPAGVEEHGVHIVGFPRNSRDLIESASKFGFGVVPNPKHPALGLALRTEGSETTQCDSRRLDANPMS